jgi:hypothetical protein
VSKNVTYMLDGQPVTSEEFFDRIAGGGRQAEIQQTTVRIEKQVCDIHGEHATVTEVDQTPNGFGFTIAGCCDDLIDRAYESAAALEPSDAIPTAR